MRARRPPYVRDVQVCLQALARVPECEFLVSIFETAHRRARVSVVGCILDLCISRLPECISHFCDKECCRIVRKQCVRARVLRFTLYIMPLRNGSPTVKKEGAWGTVTAFTAIHLYS